MASIQQALDDVIRRVQGEYIEMPGLRLTSAQAQRLWGLDRVACDALLDALVDAKGFLALPTKDADILDPETLAQIAAMTKEVTDFEATMPDLPALMSVEDAKIVPTLPVHIRGSYLTLGKPVERGFPAVMRTSFTDPILRGWEESPTVEEPPPLSHKPAPTLRLVHSTESPQRGE